MFTVKHTFIAVAIVVALAGIAVLAYGHRCQCTSTTTCQSYTLSETVFIGEFVRYANPDEIPSRQTGIFKVRRMLKGEARDTEEVMFAVRCNGTKFEAGREYLVYKYPEPYREMICDHTSLSADSALDIAYAERLRESPLEFAIEGRVEVPNGERFEGVRVAVGSGSSSKEVFLDESGWFRHVVNEPGEYRVKVSFPDDRSFTVHELGFQRSLTSAEFEYTVTVRESGCDLREFVVGDTN